MVHILTLQQAYQSLTDDIIVIGCYPFNELLPKSSSKVDYRLDICVLYIDQLKRKYGIEPGGCRFFILRTDNTAGYEYEAAIQYARDNSNAINYATMVEFGDLYWDDVAKSQLLLLFPPSSTE